MGVPRMRLGEESDGHVEFTFDRGEEAEEDEEEEKTTMFSAPQELAPIQICSGPLCSRDAHYRCSVCWDTWYCSVACQRKAWRKHKGLCVKKPRPSDVPKNPPVVTADPPDEKTNTSENTSENTASEKSTSSDRSQYIEATEASELEEAIVIEAENDPLVPQHLVDE